MEIEIRTPGDDDVADMLRVDGSAFGIAWNDEWFERSRPNLDLERFRLARADGETVGVAGSYGFEMTVPGGASLPTGGVTWVGVLLTHRRRGVLRGLLDVVHADIDARDEPIAALLASEGGIYERFGYGIATRDRRVEIDRRTARLRPEYADPVGGVSLVHGDDVVPVITDRWERARTSRPGEITRSSTWQTALVAERGPTATYAVHRDGYAAWKLTQDWSHGTPAHRLDLLELVAATAEAHLALWQTVLAVDLVGPIVSTRVPMDDPLPYLLADPRTVRTTAVGDGLWIDVRDVPAAFSARTYGTEDHLVVEVDGVRWRIGADGCTRVRTKPDLTGDRSCLGPLLLGGVRPSALVAGGRMTARTPEALRRGDAMFVTAPEPHCQTSF